MNEQRELRMLRAGGILPIGVSAPSLATASTPVLSSPVAAGRRRPQGSPPLLARLVDASRNLSIFVMSAKVASEARWRVRRRSEGGGRGRASVGGASRASASSTGHSGSEERFPHCSLTESDLPVEHRMAREDIVVLSEGRQVPRSGVGGAAGTWDGEMGEGWRVTASRFGLGGSGSGGDGGEPVQTLPASMPVGCRSTRGGGKDRQGGRDPAPGDTWRKGATAEAADQKEEEYVHSNPLCRRGISWGSSGRRFDRAEVSKMYESICKLLDGTQRSTSTVTSPSSPAGLPRLRYFAD